MCPSLPLKTLIYYCPKTANFWHWKLKNTKRSHHLHRPTTDDDDPLHRTTNLAPGHHQSQDPRHPTVHIPQAVEFTNPQVYSSKVMSELRYRTNTATMNYETGTGSTSQSTRTGIPSLSAARREGSESIAASTLLQSSPSQHGQVMKLNIPLIYSFSPTCLQRVLHYTPAFLGLKPSWKKRYLIQIGKYLYKFSSQSDVGGGGVAASQSRMKQKGSPIPLDTIQAKTVHSTRYGLAQSVTIHGHNSDEIIAVLQDLPTFCDGYFAITTNGTTRYYAVSTKEEASTWVNSIREGRQSTITRKMGHDGHMGSYPKSWEYIDQRGDASYNRKIRIKERIRDMERKEMEMTEFAEGMSGTMPRGYYG